MGIGKVFEVPHPCSSNSGYGMSPLCCPSAEARQILSRPTVRGIRGQQGTSPRWRHRLAHKGANHRLSGLVLSHLVLSHSLIVRRRLLSIRASLHYQLCNRLKESQQLFAANVPYSPRRLVSSNRGVPIGSPRQETVSDCMCVCANVFQARLYRLTSDCTVLGSRRPIRLGIPPL